MKILRIGDPHVKVSNIDESDSLMEFVSSVAIKNKVDRIEILGDLFHTHAILRLEVLDFWNTWIDALSDIAELVILVGNHDQTGDYNSELNALSVFNRIKKKNLHVIQYPKNLGVFGYLPYIHDNRELLAAANALIKGGARVIVGHITFEGSKFENGFYAPGGVNPEEIDCKLIISGHIHARQRFSTNKGQSVIYPGTAKWDTASDANQEKGLWLVEHSDTGEIIKEEFIDTSQVCSPIVSVDFKEGDSLPEFPKNARVKINLIGSSDWIKKQKTKFKGKHSISTKITDKNKPTNRKAGNSFQEFISEFYASSVDKKELLEYLKELKIV